MALPSPVPTPKTNPTTSTGTVAGGYLLWIRDRARAAMTLGQPCLSLAPRPQHQLSAISKGSPPR